MSQESQILQHLKRRPITPLVALERYGVFRLAARINSLRGRGHPIEMRMVERKGKRFAEYSMAQKQQRPKP